MDPAHRQEAHSTPPPTLAHPSTQSPTFSPIQIGLARGLVASDFGAVDPGLLAKDFKFVGPLVGPLPKVRSRVRVLFFWVHAQGGPGRGGGRVHVDGDWDGDGSTPLLDMRAVERPNGSPRVIMDTHHTLSTPPTPSLQQPPQQPQQDTFVKAFSSFNLRRAFPDIDNTAFDFRVDPYDPTRVWFTVRSVRRKR